MCVIVVNMKTATTREVQHHFSRVLDWVDAGEEVVITRRGKRVATLGPIHEEADPMEKKVNWNESLQEWDKNLADLPRYEGTLMEAIRKDERY